MDLTKIIWAKKALCDDGNQRWLPLKQHLLDTKNVISLLYQNYLSDGQRKLIRMAISSEDYIATNEDGKKVASFVGLVHDIGKGIPAFQMKKSFERLDDLDSIIENRLKNYHLIDSNSTLRHASESPHALAGAFLLSNLEINSDIVAIVSGHHGRPINKEFFCKNQRNFNQNYYLIDDDENETYQLWDSIHKQLLKWTLDEAGYDNKNQIPLIHDIAAQVVIYGLLVMADWIASNTDFFPLFDADQFENNDINRYQQGWQKWMKTYEWAPELHLNADRYYQNRFGFKPRDFQRKIFEKINQVKNGGIVIIEAGMGQGKTEAALATAEQLANTNGSNGLFFALPTQATTNAMFTRVENWLKEVAIEDDADKSIKLMHGKASLNDDFNDLPPANDIDLDGNSDARIVTNEWFSGNKKAILDDFILGTTDQVLLLSLKRKHLELRHLGLSKKVVIIDEVHSYDCYMQSYLKRSLYWLGRYNVPVIILSATLAVNERKALLSAYLNSSNKLPESVNDKQSYPLMSYSDNDQVKIVSDFESQSEVCVDVKSLDEKELVNKLKDLLSDGGIAGIVVDTVKRAQTFATLLLNEFDDNEVEIIHSSFIASERAKKERNLVDSLGKNGNRPHLKIVIGTQILEQSIDCDWDVLFSDIAPLDLLLQRIGRLHRHKKHDKSRPKKLVKPTVYVMGMNENYEYSDGINAVYADYLLMRSQYILPKKITIPSDIPKLVNLVYSDNGKSLFDDVELQAKYLECERQYNSYINKETSKAGSYMLSKFKNKHKDLVGWLKDDYDGSDANGNAQVRDTDDSIEVIVVKKIGEDGYGYISGVNDISGSIEHCQKELSNQTLKLPVSFSKSYRIDSTIKELEKYNRKYLSNWQDYPWLKGQLGIILDDNLKFKLNGYKITYSSKLGLMYDKDVND